LAIGKPDAFEGERRRARDAGVHLEAWDDCGRHVGIDRELMFDPAGSTPTRRMIRPRHVAHPLVFLVGQRQRRRHGDAVAGVHAHRSMFSIEQMTTKLSATSRITSSSNSFQPMTDSSTRIS
jgi:hypothetical protein